jgi:hypothetical protein
MKYVVLAVASDIEAERLIEDLTEHPGVPLRTPRGGSAVHATLTTKPFQPMPVHPERSPTPRPSREAADVSASPAMDHHERMRLRAAAFRASRVYPGPVGALLSRELLSWEEFGYRFGSQGLIMGIVEAVMTAQIQQPGAA